LLKSLERGQHNHDNNILYATAAPIVFLDM
jgi:hypothetical protein